MSILVEILFNQACLVEGQELEDPFTYVKQVNDMLRQLITGVAV